MKKQKIFEPNLNREPPEEWSAKATGLLNHLENYSFKEYELQFISTIKKALEVVVAGDKSDKGDFLLFLACSSFNYKQ